MTAVEPPKMVAELSAKEPTNARATSAGASRAFVMPGLDSQRLTVAVTWRLNGATAATQMPLEAPRRTRERSGGAARDSALSHASIQTSHP
jgi:hypothetical protein